MRYNSSMGNTRKEYKYHNEAKRSLYRRICIPFFSVILCVIAAFIGIPAFFRAFNPISAYSDIDMPVQYARIASTPVPEGAPLVPSSSEAPAADAVIEPVSAAENASVETSLSIGDESPKVIEIQLRLMELGYMDGDEPTQKFGEQTKSALQRFQRTHYMAQTGVADELTLSILFSENAMIYSLEQGNQGDDVLKLQKQLGDLGYYEDKDNGYFGMATTRALSAFQTKNKLSSSGIADGETLDLLYSSKARPKIDPTPTPKPKPTKTPKPGKTPNDSSYVPVQTSSGGSSSIVQVGSGLETFISIAMAQEGKPYRYSNEGPDSFDCSGLVYYSLRSVGVSVGRMSAKHLATVESWQTVPNKALLSRGDLLFFTNSAGAGVIGHTGIFLGGDKFIHASSSAGRVVVSTWSDWCETNFQWGKRVF